MGMKDLRQMITDSTPGERVKVRTHRYSHKERERERWRRFEEIRGDARRFRVKCRIEWNLKGN
eukprot:1314526-Amorphochlora_amoeboformis.AAC.1